MLAFIFLLTACGGDRQKANEESNDSPKSNEHVEEKQGGALHVAYNAQPPNLDPQSNTNLATRDIGYHIFETLLTLNSSLEVEPMLAETYEVSEDGKVVTFHLRKGVKFHNGKELVAEDVVASMERWHELSASAQTYLAGTTYEIVDDYTVKAHIENPSTLNLYIFADLTQFAAIMPKDIIENAGSEWVEEYVGTGPYQYSEWLQDQYILLTRFEDYQSRTEPADGLAGEKKAYMDEIYFHFVQDTSTRVAGLQSGEYDLAHNIPQDSADMLDSDANIKNIIQTSSFPIILFNQKAGVFTDKTLRHAVNAAINVEDILIAAYGDAKYYEKNHALVKKEQTGWYSEEGSELYDLYDLDHAKQLLAESGYNGEEVVILTTRDKMDWYNMMVVVQRQLEHLGMNVKLEVVDSATLSERLDDENAWDLYSSAFAFRPMPNQYLFLNPEWYGWINSEEISTISEKILYASSIEEAQQYKDEFHKAFWDYLPIIKPGDSTSITSLRSDVEGFQSISGPIVWNVYLDR